ncbi:DNA-directed RNA polymerase subunit beta [Protaetiibacter mangrovi]|uniref:DNA-directed RNA polymerase subunit beta n=1 Tax=Protaetiibacter mangrovi TaxID=2970926 RepID=A0ABT1ZDK5_9MICO|nr:DNA-directed RNA polymerase subunit beta [Protaetiibacter mangrovi]MCS0498773.1 DNA-directed RNA polymerase subunit beta [Protaetiibacter mangrovi]
MADDFHKPTLFGGREFEAFESSSPDPAVTRRIAHDTARSLVSRVRDAGDPSVVDRVVGFTDEHGLETIAELWAMSGPRTLPGALWRIYLLRVMIRQDPDGVALLFQRGTEVLATIDPIVAGAPTPAGPQEVLELSDRILRGVFEGDFADALERAAAFCRVEAAGAASVADDQDAAAPERSTELTTRAARLTTIAEDLASCARLARDDSLD